MTLEIAPEVAKTLASGGAVVALESTLITHGFPYPENLAVAQASEQAVREVGAVPATVAIIEGQFRAGVTKAGLAMLASPDIKHAKASTRDLATYAARKVTAGTTVAATMRIAHQAGIKLFATGGIGGVHRGVADTWDISADLTELSRTPVCVVCSGAKSLLDLPKTFEMLETLGVPVIGFGTNDVPAFYSRTSGLKVDARIDTPQEAADIIRAHFDLKLPGGILIVNPVAEDVALSADAMEKYINEALKLADAKSISGKDVTPFLLGHIAKATAGKSMEPNKRLIRDNAALAGRIAAALAV